MVKLVYRFLIYGVVILYILLDLQVFKGPMHQWLMSKRGYDTEALITAGVAATVYGKPILETQVDYKMADYLYKRGKTAESLSEGVHDMIFKYCLEALITEHLLRVKAYYNENALEITEALPEAIEHDRLQFSDPYERKDALRRQGYLEGELALRAEAQLRQEAYLDLQIKEEVSAEEASSFSAEPATLPERIKIRHLFLSTTEQPSEEVKARLESAVETLQSGARTFTELSTELNEDSRAKNTGGELDWITAEYTPAGLEGLFTLQVGASTLVKSKLGWHYVEILGKKPAETVTRSPAEVQAYLENQRRVDGLKVYLQQLRLREAKNVKILWQAGR